MAVSFVVGSVCFQCRAAAGERMDEVEHMARELAAAKKAHEVSKASFARVAISNTQMKAGPSVVVGGSLILYLYMYVCVCIYIR